MIFVKCFFYLWILIDLYNFIKDDSLSINKLKRNNNKYFIGIDRVINDNELILLI